ncbi:MAG: hypothetical protein KQH53_18210 [Desulfarculaceae bacterium]|nr:hypothetical protein [Desulfarculaceae bacterium]
MDHRPCHSPAALWGQALAVFAAYALLALWWLSPLSLHAATHLYDPGDSLLNTWALAWDWRALGRAPLALFDANAFYPARNSLAFSEHLLVPALLAGPALSLGAGPILAHNLALLLTFPLSGLGTYLLARRLSGSLWAAALAGLFFAFCPYRTLQITRLQTEAVMFAPFALWFLHRWLASGTWRDLGGFLLAYVLLALCSAYWALYGGLALLLALAWGMAAQRRWASGRRWLQLGLGGLAGAAALAPFAAPYLAARAAMGMSRGLEAVRLYAAEPASWLAAPPGLLLWGPLLSPLGFREAYLFPGLAALLLAGAGVALFRGGGKPAPRWLYLALALFSLLMSLGPEIRLAGLELNGPYRLFYEHFPGFAGLRTAARWGMISQLSLAVLAGLGLAALLARIGRAGWRAALVGLAALALAAELLPGPIPMAGPFPLRPPPPIAWLAEQSGPGAVLHLPMDSPRQDFFFRYLSTFHWRPLVNGHCDLASRGHLALSQLLQDPTPELLAGLARGGVRFVLLHRQKMLPAQSRGLEALLAVHPGLARRAGAWPWQDTVAWELIPPPGPAPLPPPASAPPPGKATASAWPQDLPRALDRDPATFWGTGRPQQTVDWFALVWQRPLELAGVELNLGYQPHMLPRGLRLELLDPAGRWQEAAFSARLAPLMAVLARPAQTPARYLLTLERPRPAKGLRLVLTRPGREPWVIAELGLNTP